MATAKPRTAPRFRVLVGCSFPPREHDYNEPGSVVDDVPPYLAGTWVQQGILEPYTEPAAVDQDEVD